MTSSSRRTSLVLAGTALAALVAGWLALDATRPRGGGIPAGMPPSAVGPDRGGRTIQQEARAATEGASAELAARVEQLEAQVRLLQQEIAAARSGNTGREALGAPSPVELERTLGPLVQGHIQRWSDAQAWQQEERYVWERIAAQARMDRRLGEDARERLFAVLKDVRRAVLELDQRWAPYGVRPEDGESQYEGWLEDWRGLLEHWAPRVEAARPTGTGYDALFARELVLDMATPATKPPLTPKPPDR